MKIHYIYTNAGLSLVLDGKPRTVSADHPRFEQIVDLVESGADAKKVLDILDEPSRRLKEILGLTPNMLFKGGVIEYNGHVLHNYAADRLIALIAAGKNHKPLANFLEKLQANPSKRVVDHLYKFLEHGNIPLAEDGDFLAYKAVRHDFKDIHSGTFDNSVGAVCSMQRNHVDENPDRTCSAGLHVCSFNYLPHFSHADGHVMMVKVNPADVVAIPADYNNTKMRVSRYVVVSEVTDYYRRNEDVLSKMSDRSEFLEPVFTLYDSDDDKRGEFYTLEEAQIWANRFCDEEDIDVRVEDDEGYVVYEARTATYG